MLERVALGQTRFVMPGVATDGRGIVLGKLGVLVFPSIDGVISWLRLYGDEDSLDDLIPTTRIVRGKTQLGSRAFLLIIPASSSYVLDRAARCARLAGGAAYTGTSKHFIKYRDDRSPYGYDALDLGGAPAHAEWVLHGEDSVQPYLKDGEISVKTLVFRLSLRRIPGSERLDAEARRELYLTVASGLAPGLVRYLLRNRVRAEATLVDLEEKSAFAAPGEPDSYLLLRAHDLPERLVDGLRGVPGVALFRPAADGVGVEVGWRHPISVTSMSSLFARDRFYLFWGTRDRLDVVKGPLVFSAAEHLAPLTLDGMTEGALSVEERTREARSLPATAEAAGAVGVALRLVPSLAPPRRVVASLVAWEEAPRLKKLLYALPPVLLRGHQLALTDRGLLLLGGESVDVIPLGTLLTETAPGLLIPLGMDLIPRVPNDVLVQAIELAGAGGAVGASDARRLTVFPHGAPPFFVSAAALQPLERRVLARLAVPEARDASLDAGVEAAGAARVVNDPVGRFALWGFKSPPVKP
jgi:hypothetical protein